MTETQSAGVERAYTAIVDAALETTPAGTVAGIARVLLDYDNDQLIAAMLLVLVTVLQAQQPTRDAREAREAWLREIGFEDPTEEQRRRNLAMNTSHLVHGARAGRKVGDG